MDIKRIGLFSAISAILGFLFPFFAFLFPFFFQLYAWLLWYFFHRKWKKSTKKISYWGKGIEFFLVLSVFFLAYTFLGFGLLGAESNAGYVSFIPFSSPFSSLIFLPIYIPILDLIFRLLTYYSPFSVLILIALWDIAILIMEKIWDYLEEKGKTVQIIIKGIIIVLIMLNMIISNFILLGAG